MVYFLQKYATTFAEHYFGFVLASDTAYNSSLVTLTFISRSTNICLTTGRHDGGAYCLFYIILLFLLKFMPIYSTGCQTRLLVIVFAASLRHDWSASPSNGTTGWNT